MSASMSVACLLVIAGRAEALMAMVKARAAVDENSILVVIGWV
jgi:hypothetical protein